LEAEPGELKINVHTKVVPHAEDTTYELTALHKAQIPLRPSRHDKRDMQHKRTCGAHSLAANSSANVLLSTIRLLFWLVHHVKIICYRRKKTLSTRFRVKVIEIKSEVYCGQQQ